jgi:hypothetical protein
MTASLHQRAVLRRSYRATQSCKQMRVCVLLLLFPHELYKRSALARLSQLSMDPQILLLKDDVGHPQMTSLEAMFDII